MSKTVTIDEIKNFAHSQLGLKHDDVKVSVSDGEFAIVDPWHAIGPNGKAMSDREARDYWGDDLVNEIITRATEYLSNK